MNFYPVNQRSRACLLVAFEIIEKTSKSTRRTRSWNALSTSVKFEQLCQGCLGGRLYW